MRWIMTLKIDILISSISQSIMMSIALNTRGRSTIISRVDIGKKLEQGFLYTFLLLRLLLGPRSDDHVIVEYRPIG
jgi:hypothetical protein